MKLKLQLRFFLAMLISLTEEQVVTEQTNKVSHDFYLTKAEDS